MPLLKRNFITILLITINTVVFMVMVCSGVKFFSPDVHDLIRYGANFNALVCSGDYYRLLTHQFIHVGLIHLFVNMMALYSLGSNLEVQLGKFIYLSVYLLSGLAGGLLSASLHSFIVSSGASGAIMGLAGANLALILKHEGTISSRFKQFIAASITVLINLVIGFWIPFIDNAAHIGGLLFGFAFTYMLFKSSDIEKSFIRIKDIACVCISLIVFFFFTINLPIASYTYYKAFNSFINFEQIAINQSEGKGYIETQKYIKQMKEVKTTWTECSQMLDSIQGLPPDLSEDITNLNRYTFYKIKSLDYYIRAISDEDYELLDSMELNNLIISILPKAKHGIPPEQEKKDTVPGNEVLRKIKIYYDKNWKETVKSSALFYRESEVDSLNRVNGFVDDYFINGRIQMKGHYFNDLRNGVFRFYYPNGNFESLGKYVLEKPTGKWKTYYANGQTKEEIIYGDETILLKSFWDSLGSQLIINGTGPYVFYNEDGSVKDIGNYLDGLKTGIWYGNYSFDQPYYTETFLEGRLINGTSYTAYGDSFRYFISYVPPQPLTGNQSYKTYLKNNLHYPREAIDHRIEGTILIDISIDATGQVVDIENVNKLGHGCDEEAKRLVKDGPGFTAALDKGQPVQAVKRVEVRFELPEIK